VPYLKLWVSPRTAQRHFSLQVEKEGSAGEEAREAQKYITSPGYRCVPPWLFEELVEKVLVKNSRDLAIHEGVPDLDTSSSAHAAAGQDSGQDRVSERDDTEAQNSLSDLNGGEGRQMLFSFLPPPLSFHN
jgi:hypothetical protein